MRIVKFVKQGIIFIILNVLKYKLMGVNIIVKTSKDVLNAGKII